MDLETSLLAQRFGQTGGVHGHRVDSLQPLDDQIVHLHRESHVPMLEEIFPTREEFVHAMRSNANNHGLNILKSKTLGEFAGQVENNILWLLYNADLIFFLGLMALFLLLILRKKRWLYPSTSAVARVPAVSHAVGSDIARLYAANYGVVVLCIALAVSWLTRQIQGGRWLSALIIISLIFTFTQQRLYYLSSPNIRWFGDVHLSEPARRAWLNERGHLRTACSG